MSETINYPRPNPFFRFLKGIGMFLLFPLIGAILLYLLATSKLEAYREQHDGRIYTGVSVWDFDVSGLTVEEASAKLLALTPSIERRAITLVDPVTGNKWSKTLDELGVSVTLGSIVDRAYEIGRTGDERDQLEQQILVWYNGVDLGGGPGIEIDESPTDAWVLEIANEINVEPVGSELIVDKTDISYTQPQAGRRLNTDTLRNQILAAVNALESAEIALATSEVVLETTDYSDAADVLHAVTTAPIAFYIDKPLDGLDLNQVELSADELSTWMQLDSQHKEGEPLGVTIDEAQARAWVEAFSPKINRYPQRARFYFDDFTSELVLIEPHVNGRKLNVDATVEKLLEAAVSEERTVAFVVDDIVPVVHSNVTGAELGIIEEITSARRTTSFAGSPPERRHNIARVAQNYYGLVIAPGEEFSFNRYLDALTEENGYVEGLIIAGGSTQQEVGGGICQVSTTIFQSAFWGGFDLGERLQHSYRVGYYENDPSNPGVANIGMDATIYKPLVDFTFTNNTPHHLLIENYYDGPSGTMTVKFYSTDLGRTVDMKREILSTTEPSTAKCVYNPDLAPGEVKQVEWRINGANVLVERYVYNYLGQQKEYLPIRSNYIAMRDVYEYGDGVDPNAICVPPPAAEAPEPEGGADDPNATATPEGVWPTPTP